MHLENNVKLFKKIFYSLLAFIFSLGLFVSPAYAASNDLVSKFTSDTLGVLFGVGSLVGVIFLIKGGFIYITSNGHPEHLEEGKKIIRNSILGLVIILSAAFISSLLNNAFVTPSNGVNPTQIVLNPIEAVKPSNGLTQVLLDAVNGFIQNIVASATKPLLDGIQSFLASTPSVVSNSVIFNYWLIILGIVDSLFALGIAALGFQVMSASSFGFEEVEFKHILPRVGLAFLAANISIYLADWVIQAANTLTNALIVSTGGLDKAWILNSVDFQKLLTNPDQSILITGLFALLFVALCVVLLLMYVTRLILVATGAVMGPFIFLLWALPKTAGMAETLIKSYFVTVFTIFVHVVIIQLASAFLAIPGQSGTNALVSIIVAIGLLFTLIRIPQWLFTAVLVTSSGGRLVKVGGQLVNVLVSNRSQSGDEGSSNRGVKKPRRNLSV